MDRDSSSFDRSSREIAAKDRRRSKRARPCPLRREPARGFAERVAEVAARYAIGRNQKKRGLPPPRIRRSRKTSGGQMSRRRLPASLPAIETSRDENEPSRCTTQAAEQAAQRRKRQAATRAWPISIAIARKTQSQTTATRRETSARTIW